MQSWTIFQVESGDYMHRGGYTLGWYYETPSGDVCGPYKTETEAQSAMQKERGWNKG